LGTTDLPSVSPILTLIQAKDTYEIKSGVLNLRLFHIYLQLSQLKGQGFVPNKAKQIMLRAQISFKDTLLSDKMDPELKRKCLILLNKNVFNGKVFVIK